MAPFSMKPLAFAALAVIGFAVAVDSARPVESRSLTQRDCHPDGLLTRQLNGESYGGKWYKESVPDSVLAWLASLPAYQGRLQWFNWPGDLAAFSVGDSVILHSHTQGKVERISTANNQLVLRLDNGKESICYPGDCKHI